MPKDSRNFIGSVSVRLEDTRIRMELSPAEDHGGEPGQYRVRIDRRWLDSPEGDKLFFDRTRLGELVAEYMFTGAIAELPENAPDIPRSARVSIMYWHHDTPYSELAYTATPPVRCFDGQFYVGVMTYHGFRFIPVTDVALQRRNCHE